MKLVIINLFFVSSAFAQLPETDIWLLTIKKKDSVYVYSNPLNITKRVGYENQPAFSIDDKTILYARVDSTKQSDIYQYNIKKKKHLNITKSNLSEFSPTLLPSGKEFSAVVVEKDSVQRIWKFNLDGSFKYIIHEGTDSIGYYTWLNDDTLLYYKLTNPHSLRSLNLLSNEDVWLCDNPTRSFRKIENSSKFIYAIKDSSRIEFRIYNPSLRESTVYASYPSLSEDFIWHPVLGLIKSEHSNLWRFNEKKKQWEVLFSFASLGIKNVTRFVFDSKLKQLAIVSSL